MRGLPLKLDEIEGLPFKLISAWMAAPEANQCENMELTGENMIGLMLD